MFKKKKDRKERKIKLPLFFVDAFNFLKVHKFFALFLLLLLILAGGAGVIAFSSRPAFCSTCHLMDKDINAWEKSTHQNVNCIKCHVEPGLIPLIKDKIMAVKHPVTLIFGNIEEPINKESEVAEKMHDESCLHCHPLRKVKKYDGIIMNHEAHFEKVKCSVCHNRVAHPLKGYKNHLSMNFCFTCHNGRALRDDCTLCHTEKFVQAYKERSKE
jgi:nitrate/TMAO reductase-like tetraheme cytochrome c subunit